MSELVCSLLEGRVRLSRAGRAHRLEQAPLHVHQKPSTSLEGLFRSGDKRKNKYINVNRVTVNSLWRYTTGIFNRLFSPPIALENDLQISTKI